MALDIAEAGEQELSVVEATVVGHMDGSPFLGTAELVQDNLGKKRKAGY